MAQSIEKVFDERLHEFYGMLALHYIKGENYEKAEEYLIKAGEEALRSSASSEALNYYQEGLKLYLQANQDTADPEKLAMFEKNIAIALYNKCRWVEAFSTLIKFLNIGIYLLIRTNFFAIIEVYQKCHLYFDRSRSCVQKDKKYPVKGITKFLNYFYKWRSIGLFR